MLCRFRASVNNNNWPAPGRRGYSLDNDGEPRSPYEGNTAGAANDTRERPGSAGRLPADPMSPTLVRHLRGRWTRGVIEHVPAWRQQIVDRRNRLGGDTDDGGERDTAVEAPLPRQ